MEKIKLLSRGKINLSLNILGKKDNLHLIDSVMQSVSLGDFLTAQRRSDGKINISFTGEDAHLIDKDDNSVKKTVDYLKNIFGNFGADITVEKGLPLSGGLGGSSADMAAALVALSLLFDFDKRGLDIAGAAAELSSDLSFMIKGGCARVTGTGEKILPLPNNLPLYIVVAHAGAQINSRDAYARFDALCHTLCYCPADNDKLAAFLNNGDANAFNYFFNALQPASESLSGNITKVNDALLAAGAYVASMTGSGGCCAGFFKNKRAAKKAAAVLRKQGLWAKDCVSAGSGLTIL